MCLIILGGLSTSMLGDTPAPLKPDAIVDPASRLNQYIEAMNSDEWHVRKTATTQLARDQRISEQLIEQRLAHRSLDQEQRLRLLRALETRLLLLPRGAIGISMKRHITNFTDKDGNEVRGVEIVELLPGMPAEEHLRVGDVLVSIEGQPFEQSDQVSTLIKQYWPGDEVELEIARDEPADAAGSPRRSRILKIKIKLGSTDQLATRSRTNPIPSGDRAYAEQRIRSLYQQYSPLVRKLQPPLNLPGEENVGSIPMGIDPELILQQIRDDRFAMEQNVPGSLTPEAFHTKWETYVRSLSDLLESNFLSPESREVIEQLRSRVLELIDIED